MSDVLDPDRWYTIAELHERIGGSDRFYRSEIAEGRLQAIIPAKEWRVLGSDALAWAEERTRLHAEEQEAKRSRRRSSGSSDGEAA